jgi:hypothetical protein
MQTSDWILVGTTLFLGAVAIFGPTVTDWIKERLYAPKLVVKFDQDSDVSVRIATYIRGQAFIEESGQGRIEKLNEKTYYIRFLVCNLGKSKLKGCEVVLEAMWVLDAGDRKVPLKSFSDVNLHWAGREDQFVDLNPGRCVYCDLGHVSTEKMQQLERQKPGYIDVPGKEDEPGLRFLLDQLAYPYGQPNCFARGKYLVQVAFISENTPKQTHCFRIAWSGKWREKDEEMFIELTMTKTDEKC